MQTRVFLCKKEWRGIVTVRLTLKFTVMKKLLLTAVTALTITASAQNNTAYTIIEGSRSLVELIRIFKTPRPMMSLLPAPALKLDSCSIKNTSDFTVKNNTAQPLVVSLYRRNNIGYDTVPMSMTVLPKNKESFFDIKSGIYKMKLETIDEDDDKKTFREGEIKINPCENPVQDITALQ